MKECYIVNVRTIGCLEVFQIGDEAKVLDRIKEVNKADFDDYDKVTASKFIDKDRSIFTRGGYREVCIGGTSVYLSKLL